VLLGWIYGFWVISLCFGGDPVRVWGVFYVFCCLHWLSLGFPLSSCWKHVNCVFWRTSGRLRVSLGMDSWNLGFSFFFGLILFFLGFFLTYFGVSVWFFLGSCWSSC